MINHPLFSIVTVVYNSISSIERTINSVIKQTSGNFEYIVIDGGSTDGTLEIIRKYRSGIDKLESGPDNGIYDAMNKGINLAEGEWILFMNAGDEFSNSDVLLNVSQLIESKNSSEIDILYGNSTAILANGKTKRYLAPNEVGDHWKGPLFRHGSMFVKTSLHKKHPFNLDRKYKICADFDFIYKMHVNGKRFYNTELDIINFEASGVSANRIRCAKDNKMIVKQYNNSLKIEIWHNFWIVRACVIDKIIVPLLRLK